MILGIIREFHKYCIYNFTIYNTIHKVASSVDKKSLSPEY